MDSLMDGNRQNNRDLGTALTVNNTLEVTMYPKGESGATFIPNVSADGIISWTNDRNLENPTSRNIKGNAATITVGTVTSGQTASIVNTGDSHNAVFDFVMPEYGTAMNINGSSAGREGVIYAPITAGSSGQILKSNGIGHAPTWTAVDYYTKNEVNTELNKKQNNLTAGTNIQINDNVISATDTTYSDATTSTHGLMTAADKTKLDGIATGATNVTVDNTLTSTSTTDALSAAQGKTLNDKFGGTKIVMLTQAEYDALLTKDSTTLYFIKP